MEFVACGTRLYFHVIFLKDKFKHYRDGDRSSDSFPVSVKIYHLKWKASKARFRVFSWVTIFKN